MRFTGAVDEAPILTIASAATTDIGAARANMLRLTGSAAIASFGSAPSGTMRWLWFDGVMSITYNATSLILPGATSIVTAAGDVAAFVSLGGGNWRCSAYMRASGAALLDVFSREYISAQQAVTFGSTLTLAHGLGGRPKLVLLALVCFEAEAGYVAGTQIELGSTQQHESYPYGITTYADPSNPTTNLIIRIATSGPYVMGGGGIAGPTPITASKWRLIVRAWL